VKLTAYILVKNEEANLANCLGALHQAGVPTIILDSGSTDRSREIAEQRGCEVERYRYRDHLEAFRYICAVRTRRDHLALVLDADMVVSRELLSEAQALLVHGNVDVAVAPVRMYWNGLPMCRGSLCPPKPFLFRGGAHYFGPLGHGEGLIPGTKVVVTRHALVHNDLKPFEAYLASQVRYAQNLLCRRALGKLSWRDRLRTTPFMMLVSPAVSYLLRGGIFAGKTGLGYALDRLIAEAIMYRQHIAAENVPVAKSLAIRVSDPN
jgi:glycosyltransferase involved in cell wall biosynthesis